MQYLLMLLGILGIGFVYQKNRADIASARNSNLDTKESLNEIDKDRAKNSGLLEAEEQKQADLRKEMEEKLTDTTLSTIVDFLNGRKK